MHIEVWIGQNCILVLVFYYQYFDRSSETTSPFAQGVHWYQLGWSLSIISKQHWLHHDSGNPTTAEENLNPHSQPPFDKPKNTMRTAPEPQPLSTDDWLTTLRGNMQPKRTPTLHVIDEKKNGWPENWLSLVRHCIVRAEFYFCSTFLKSYFLHLYRKWR